MNKKFLAVGVAATLGAVSGAANAVMAVQPNGIGHINVLPYYSVQGGNNTLISITNTDQVNGKVVKVRFRGAEFSDDVLDFQVFLSPSDVFTGAVTRNGDVAHFATADKSCTLPGTASTPGGTGTSPLAGPAGIDFVTERLPETRKLTGTLEGYIEVIEMADLPPGGAAYTATKHVKGVAPCTASTLVGPDPLNPTVPAGLAAPTGGIMSSATVIDVNGSKAFTFPGTAISPDTNPAAPVYFLQSNNALAWAANLTWDRIFAPAPDGGNVPMYQFDLPDLSTPYDPAAAGSALTQRDLTSAAILRGEVFADFVTSASIKAATDVVLTQPTRRYYYLYNLAVAPNISVATVKAADGIYTPLNATSNRIQVGEPTWYDREEQTATSGTSIVISPTPPSAILTFSLLGEVSVLSVNSSTVPTDATSAKLTAQNYEAPKVDGNQIRDGWVALSTTNPTTGALPVIGFEGINVFNSAVGAAGTNYGLTLPLRSPAP